MSAGPRITARVLSALVAGEHAAALRAYNRGEIPATVYRAIKQEIDDLDAMRRRGRAPEDPELFKAWIERRHSSLPETRERRAVEAMLRRISSAVEIYCLGFRDGSGETRPTPLADMIAREGERA